MKTPEFPIHLHFHPHYAVDDYAEVKRLAHQEENPFLVILPEIPQGKVVEQLQSISDGDEQLLNFFVSNDKARNPTVTYDQNAARMRAMAEIVFSTGMVIVSAHPIWEMDTAENNGVALGKNHQLKHTLGEAVNVMRSEIPKIVDVIRKRDEYTVNNFRSATSNTVRRIPEFKSVSRIPCLIEIGALHFMLADMLRAKGEEVQVTGLSTAESQIGYFNKSLAQLILGSPISDVDFELIAMEDLLSNSVFTNSTQDKYKIISDILAKNPRFTWANFYAKQRADLAKALREA